MSLQKLVDKMGYTQFAALLLIATLIPLLIPLGLPMSVSQYTKAFKAEIDAVPTGGVIVWAEEYPVSSTRSIGPGLNAILRYIASRGLKVVFVPSGVEPESFLVAEWIFKESGVVEDYNWIYGQDCVVLATLTGGEAALAAFALDIKGTIPTDIYGTPVSQLPLMQNINTISDFRLGIVSGGRHYYPVEIGRQWVTEHNLRMIVFMGFDYIAAYYGIWYFGNIGYGGETRALAEFELLTNQPGPFSSFTDAMNFYGLILCGFIILGNIAYLQSSRATPEQASRPRAKARRKSKK